MRTKAEAVALFEALHRQGQQLADFEQMKFAIVRDSEQGYKLGRLDDLSSAEKGDIVKRIKPRVQSGELNNAENKIRGT